MAPNEKAFSSLGLKYFSNRDRYFISEDAWLEGRRNDDNIKGLWRVHDRLYDLQNFIRKHPGGSEWLTLTKGTDITEAFETHHIKGIAETVLPQYFVKEATIPRISRFTFHDNGFYRTLKRRTCKQLLKVPKHVIQQSKLFADMALGIYLILCLLAVFSESYAIGILAGYTLTSLTIISHNFVHQKDNFRKYYFDMSMMSSRDFRLSHALSHHLFPNTIHDLEISIFEPLIHFLPQKKTILEKTLSWLYVLLLYPTRTITAYLITPFRQRTIKINTLVPWTAFFFAYLLAEQKYLLCLKMFVWIIFWCNLIFVFIGKTAAHHHPEIFHDGDTTRPADEMDFGVYQLDAVSDRPNITGSPFLVLTNFGDHALHHLFPTLDHGILEYLYPTFLQTCIEFGVEWKLYSSTELLKGALQQLLRDTPNKSPPLPLKKKIVK